VNRQSSKPAFPIYDLRFTIYYSKGMYRKPRFLEMLHAIREEMSREADYDVDLFAEMVRSNQRPAHGPERNIRGYKSRASREADAEEIGDAPPQHGRSRRAAR
jgi:hypothetical protein